MEDTQSVASLMDSTSSKIQQLQKAFAELESQRAVTLHFKWKELEEHFHGLEKSLKRRFHELEDQEKVLQTKATKAQEMLEKREAAVMAIESASLERLQKKRDAAALAISGALKKHRRESPIDSAAVNVVREEGRFVVDETSNSLSCKSTVEDPEEPCESDTEEVTSYSQLDKLCKLMDSEGLHKYISDNRKNLAAIREEIPVALKAASSPASLVLTSLADFYNMDLPNIYGKKDYNLLGIRRTCIMLMECLDVLLADDELSFSDIIPEDVQQQAKAIASEWKPKLDALDMSASNGNSLEAHAFLQLLATFGIASEFDEEYICRLIPTVSRRRQAADLCRSLGLSSKMPGVIDVLVSSGRQIDAVNLAFAFGLTEQFSPVLLLKSYIEEAVKVSSPTKAENASPSAQTEVNEKEITALKAVIKCVEEHKLEEQYPLDTLQRRLQQLEKAKAGNKKATEVAKPTPKRPCANGVGSGQHVTKLAADKSFYPRYVDRYPPYVYDRPYIYTGPPDNQGHSLMGAAAYHVPPSHNFFGNGYPYQAQYFH